jgi:hypothetical protein
LDDAESRAAASARPAGPARLDAIDLLRGLVIANVKRRRRDAWLSYL